MENRGKRATKNHRKYAFIAVFVRFLAVSSGAAVDMWRSQQTEQNDTFV
jgi:hypothetical protein